MCLKIKAADQFYQRKGRRYLEAYCKSCTHTRGRANYRKNGAYYRATAKAKRDKIRAWMMELKSTLSCSRCGYNEYPAALDFHHRDPSKKLFRLAAATAKWKSQEMILTEIAKCDVLCSNCHRGLHT